MESGALPLFPVPPIHKRIDAYKKIFSISIQLFIGDITNIGAVYHIFDLSQPDIVIHCASQSSAPFSMKNRTNAALTYENNCLGTLNLMFAIQRAMRPIHFVKLGSIGACGTPAASTKAIDVQADIACKLQPTSFQQITEATSTQILQFAADNWGHIVTEVRLGVVWGHRTKDSIEGPELVTNFHYDAIFGTVANRFLVQAAIGYPLTIYGSGKQPYAFVALEDVIVALENAVFDPPIAGRFQQLNLFNESLSIEELANLVQSCSEKAGFHVDKKYIRNPRMESRPFSNPSKSSLTWNTLGGLRLKEAMDERCFMDILQAKNNIDEQAMIPNILWNKN